MIKQWKTTDAEKDLPRAICSRSMFSGYRLYWIWDWLPCTKIARPSCYPKCESTGMLPGAFKLAGRVEARQGCRGALSTGCHQFHPDSQEKEEWVLELSFGNAGLLVAIYSQANIYKSMPRSAFKSMSLLGFKKWNRLRAIGYSPTEFKGSPTKRCWCLGLRKRAFTFPNPNLQHDSGVQPSTFGGFGTNAPGTPIQSVVSRLHLQKKTYTNGHGKTNFLPSS